MKRYVLLGLVLFVGFCIAFAPAQLIDRGLDQVDQVDLVDARGTLWNGSGNLIYQLINVGQLRWQFHPTSPFVLKPTYDWQLSEQHAELMGTAGSGLSSTHVFASGDFDAQWLNAFLNQYDIFIEGSFALDPTTVEINREQTQLSLLDGQINWTGGTVRYTLSGRLNEVTLPALTAFFAKNAQGKPQAVVYAAGESQPLIIASEGAPGFIKLGMTKLFTKMLNSPWPGSDPDHAVVLEVEEQFF